LFVETGKECLKPGGRFYLVTKQEQTLPIVEEAFEELEALERRGYVVFVGTKEGP
jgi:hypothetical protein